MEEKVPEKFYLKVTPSSIQELWSKAKKIIPLSLKVSFFNLIFLQFLKPSILDGGAAAKININCSRKRNWGIIPPLHHQG